MKSTEKSSVIRDDDIVHLDNAISKMIKRVRRSDFSCYKWTLVNYSDKIYKIDEIISDSLNDLRPNIPEDPADKLFIRMGDKDGSWSSDDIYPAWYLYVRLFDTLKYLSSFKGKFVGREIKSRQFTKEHAYNELKNRGLARRR